MSRFGSTSKPEETTDAAKTDQSTQTGDQKPLATDVEKAQITPPPSTDSLGLNQSANPASASAMMDNRDQGEASQDELNKALQMQADKIREAQNAQPTRDLTQGNVVAGTMTTHSLAYDTLAQLGQPYKEDQAATKPAGYYTVHFGTIKGEKGAIKGESVGSQVYFDPKRLDKVAKAGLDRYVKAGYATLEGSTNDTSATAE